MKTIYAYWGGGKHYVKLTWLPQFPVKQTEVTSAHCVCVNDGKVLLSYIKGRGFNLPGGHIDEDETVDAAVHREVLEEAYVEGEIYYLGCIEVSHEENSNFDPNGKYPKIGYQAFYRMDVTACLPFLREYEATTRVWVEPAELPFVLDDHELAIHIVNAAFEGSFEVNEKLEFS
ncbi:MAG: NUDIX domain-containing protein [Solibacillus sp.]|jgi:8-oxo-dGTP diphosphatase|uniref:NUDIX hydrolase n=1 Tax=unclassified Solibacillus TaxID=2637870 RepID=UPI0030F81F10